MKIFINKYAVLIYRIFIGAVFIWASWDKILHPEIFVRDVHNYRILPVELENIFALTLPWIEFISGIFIILGIFIEASSILISFMLLVFIFALSSALARGLDINCGCFHTGRGERIAWSLILRDFLLFIPLIGILFGEKGFLSLKKVTQR